MASTYTDAGIELIGVGEQSNTWGQTTNTNWRLMEEMATGVVQISLNGLSSYSLTTTDGVTSNGRHLVIEFTGSPGATCTVTVVPNDMQKVYFINNATDQTVAITQGSGSTVSVPAGTKKLVYCDGAGSGATVTDLTDNLSLSGEVNITTFKLDGVEVTADAAEINKLDGLLTSTAELNVLDGITATTAELNKVDGFTGNKDDLNYAKDLRATGVSTTEFERLDGLTASTGELNTLDGIVASTAELNTLDGFTGSKDDLNYAKDLRATGVTTTEFDKLDGLTASTSELNTLDGITASTAELNKTDGLTASTGELNKLDGFTGDAADLNYARDLRDTGVTATEFNRLDGVTSSIQTQLNNKQPIDSDLTTLGGLSKTNGNFIVADGSSWTAESGSTARASLGLGNVATLNNGAGNGIDADRLDGQQGSYYLDYNNFNNTPPTFRLMSRVSVLATSSTGTVTSSVSPSTFGGITPDFVMYFASAYESGIADLRYYSVNFGNSFSQSTLVLGGGSDDTDQGSTADIICTASFTLPYQESQQFYVRYSGNNSGPPVLRIWAIGFQA